MFEAKRIEGIKFTQEQVISRWSQKVRKQASDDEIEFYLVVSADYDNVTLVATIGDDDWASSIELITYVGSGNEKEAKRALYDVLPAARRFLKKLGIDANETVSPDEWFGSTFDEENLDEFSSLAGGAVAGYTLPLGASNKRQKRSK